MQLRALLRPLSGVLVLATLLAGASLRAEEGMYPINLLARIDLQSRGIKLRPADLYNPDSVGLVNAVVRLGGCTGSFISADGLILTNHHCVFGYVQAASSKERDYITDGFRARTRQEELPAPGATVRIIESYRDVSAEILGAVPDSLDAPERSRAIERKGQELIRNAERKNPGKRAEMSEMIAGESYILFLFTTLRDVRLVYVPPRAIGEYGGEEDNYEWPRHTGDFSFVRAYAAPDGSPADYSPLNVPYHPRKCLKVQPAGVGEGDPVFILGYPGRTFRHRPAAYLGFEETVRMPYLVDLYSWQIRTLEEIGAQDRGIALKFDARIKTIANVVKNYQGKLVGMQRLRLVDRKREEESAFRKFVEADPGRRARYGTLLKDFEEVYAEMTAGAGEELTLDNLRTSSVLLGNALTMVEAAMARKRLEAAKDTAGVLRLDERTRQTVLNALRDFHREADQTLLTEMLRRESALPAGQRLEAVKRLTGDKSRVEELTGVAGELYDETFLHDPGKVATLLAGSPDEILESDDPFLRLASSLVPAYSTLRERRQRRDSRLGKLQADLNEARMKFLKQSFIPDANSTLRFTSGTIKGYAPADAVWARPITTLDGVVRKATGREPFNPPAALLERYRARMWGRYGLPGRNTVPVALLYDLDTTGGNSGSPLLNARGELVGVNFDRAFEATVNDYVWSPRYSRSIAVDIRYVLWVTTMLGGADNILQEIGIQGP